MKRIYKQSLHISDAGNVLENYIHGFRRIYLETDAHIEYASNDFLKMTGYTRDEISSLFANEYCRMIYDEDVLAFKRCIKELGRKEGIAHITYRLKHRDGRLLQITDMIKSVRGDSMWGLAVAIKVSRCDEDATQPETTHTYEKNIPAPSKSSTYITSSHSDIAAQSSTQNTYEIAETTTDRSDIKKTNKNGKHIYIRTFGYFDVFVDDVPIMFKNYKAKELLALLVDRRGGYISSKEAIVYLWEQDMPGDVLGGRYRKTAMLLKRQLEEYGIDDIILVQDGSRSINKNVIDCDLYDYLSGQPQYRHLFRGAYMLNYLWSEYTIAMLEGGR